MEPSAKGPSSRRLALAFALVGTLGLAVVAVLAVANHTTFSIWFSLVSLFFAGLSLLQFRRTKAPR
jgi:hypothetical protein